MPVPSNVLQALTELLVVQSPQVASRLKQRLTAALQAKGSEPFDERKLGYKGFRDFLQRGTENLFVVTPTEDGADVVVALPGKSTAQTLSAGVAGDALGTTVRSEVWQAFINPDPTRLRYFNRRSFVVRHFLRGEDSPHAKEVQAAPEDFVEIPSITGEEHVRWMKEFVEKKGIESPQREVLETIISKPYTSGVNAAFTGALRELGKEWSHFRVEQVIDTIAGWAKANEISAGHLNPRPAVEPAVPTAPQTKKANNLKDHPSSSSGVTDPREQAVRLLDMLSDDEIGRVVLPILLSTLLVRGKG